MTKTMYVTSATITEVGRWNDIGHATFSDGRTFEFLTNEGESVELFNSRRKINSPKRTIALDGYLAMHGANLAQQFVDRVVSDAILALPGQDEDTIRERARFNLNGGKYNGLVSQRVGAMLRRSMSLLYGEADTADTADGTLFHLACGKPADECSCPEEEGFAIPLAPVSATNQDINPRSQEKPLLLQEFRECGSYFVLGYHEDIPGICDLVIETDPRLGRDDAIDDATSAVEDYCHKAGLDFARDVAWSRLVAHLPNGIAIKPLASCVITSGNSNNPKNNARALLIEMANAMAKLFGVCELNMDDLEENTCDTLTECDALLDKVRGYLASN